VAGKSRSSPRRSRSVATVSDDPPPAAAQPARTVLLTGSLVPTTWAGHLYWTVEDPGARKLQRIQFHKNMAMIGGQPGKPPLHRRALALQKDPVEVLLDQPRGPVRVPCAQGVAYGIIGETMRL